MEYSKCNNCGNPVSPQYNICPHCGTSQNTAQNNSQPILQTRANNNQNQNQNNNPNNTKNIIIIIGGIIIVLLLALLIFLIVKSNIFSNSQDENEKIENVETGQNSAKNNESNDSTTLKHTTSATDKEIQPQAPPTESRQAMVINDADGWTNIRASMSSKAAIVDKVYDGTVFYVTYTNNSKWCKFYWDQTSPSVGYIYKKYIKPVGSSKTPPNQQKAKSHYGKYHIIVGSCHSYSDAYNLSLAVGSADFDHQIIYSSSVNAYRVSAYSSNSKSDAQRMLSTVRYYFADAWLLSE